VVLAPFRFTDETVIKHRPVVVLSAAAFQGSRAEVIVAALTSNLHRPLLMGDYVIRDWQGAGLPKPSRATAILRTIRYQLIVAQFGTMPAPDMAAIERAIATALDLQLVTR
jgi:mRNA interferase MazF